MIASIQALRAIAAILVVLFHTSAWENTPAMFDFLGGWGRVGVDIFFVISGFIMVIATNGKSISPVAFIKNRAIRVVPIYWVLTTLWVALIFFLPSVLSGSSFDAAHFLASLFLVSQIAYGAHPLVGVGWTLEFEAFFYLVFGAALVARTERVRLLIVCVCVSAAVLLGASQILLEFVFGVLAAIAYLHLPRMAPAAFVGLGAAALLSSAMFSIDLPRVLLWGIPSAFLVYGVAHSPNLFPRFLVKLGDASYSIYLVHVFTVKGVVEFMDGWLGTIVALLLSVFGGWVVYQLIENPMLQLLRKNLGKVREATAPKVGSAARDL